MSTKLVFETRAKCQDFVSRCRDDGIPMKLTVLSSTPKQLSRSANLSHVKTGVSERHLRLCGECWPNSSRFSSLMVMAKVPSLSLHSTPVHKFSASRIEETAWANQFSNLPLLEVDSCLPLFHLICLFLVFLVKCCNGSSLKPARSMCDGSPFASPHFRRQAGRAPFSAVSLSECSTLCALFDSLPDRA